MTSLTPTTISSRASATRRGNMLCLDQYGNIGGGQRSLLDLLPAFSQSGWEVRAAVTGTGALNDALHCNGYRTYSLSAKTYSSTRKPPFEILNYALELPAITTAVQRITESENIELLYVNGPRLVPPAAWVARKMKIPLIFHCHNRLFQESAIMLVGESLRLANAWVIASCKYAAQPIQDYIWPERLKIFYNGVKQIERKQPRKPHTMWRIGVIGRVEKEKGQLEFVHAAKLVMEKFPDCRFSVIGSALFSGSEYYLQVKSAARNTPIEFVEWQNNSSAIYSNLDLVIVPSNGLEATTRVILEAFSAGIPVVAFPSGGIPEVLYHERTGFLTAEPTSGSLARQIVALLQMNPTYLECIVRQAREEWAQRFSLDAYRDHVTGLLTQVSRATRS